MDTQPPRDQNPKALLKGKEKKKLEEKRQILLSAWLYLKERREKNEPGGNGFPQDCLELRLSAFATVMRWRGTCVVMGWKFRKKKNKKHVCVLFQCEAGRCTEGFYHVCLVKPL